LIPSFRSIVAATGALPVAFVLACLAGPLPALAQSAGTAGAPQQAQTETDLADAVANRLYRTSIEYEIYLAFWPELEKQFKQVEPDIPTWELAQSQLIARRLAGQVYDAAKAPLLEKLAAAFSEDELKAILAVPRGEDAAEAFSATPLGRKVASDGSKAASEALNGKMLELVQAQGEEYAVAVMRAAIEQGILPPPPSQATEPLPPSFGPVSPVPPIPMTPPKRD